MNDLNLLLVEDNPSEAFMVERIINKVQLGSCYKWFSDGEEALNYLQREDSKLPTVILLDIQMPRISGLEVLEIIKSNQRTKGIPVVMFSSSYEEKDINTAYKYGANSYLVKPTEFSNLKTTIMSIVDYWLKLNKTLI